MQHQYVTLDFPTKSEVPPGAVANAIAAQTLGMAGRAIYQLINECSGSDQLDEFGCLRWRGYWRSASASPMAGRHLFSPYATSVPREKTIKKASHQASFCERGRRQMSRSIAKHNSEAVRTGME